MIDSQFDWLIDSQFDWLIDWLGEKDLQRWGGSDQGDQAGAGGRLRDHTAGDTHDEGTE